MQASDMVKNAERTQVATGRYGLSAWAAQVQDAEELVRCVPTLLLRRFISCSTVGRCSQGFAVEPTGPLHHCTIWLPDTRMDTIKAVKAAFGPPQDNPLWKPRR